MYCPRNSMDARRLTPVLEIAARNVAQKQVEDITGIRVRGK
jgi:hypothetical protein